MLPHTGLERKSQLWFALTWNSLQFGPANRSSPKRLRARVFSVSLKKLIQFGMRNSPVESLRTPLLRQFPRGPDEPRPGGPRERGTNTDAANSYLGEIPDPQSVIRTEQHVDGLE